MDSEKHFSAAREAFGELEELFSSFKASKGSELVKDLKFYKSIYGFNITSSMNKMQLQIQSMQEQLNSVFLPKKYPSGDLRLFNSHQFEMIDLYLDPKATLPSEADEKVIWKDPKPRNKFMEMMENTTRNKNILKPQTNKIFVRNSEDHPYAMTINSLDSKFSSLHAMTFDESSFNERTLESVPLNWVDTTESLEVMYAKLKKETILAVDLEHHSFHSYTGLVSLMQISSATEDFLVDTIKLRETLQSSEYSLNVLFADPNILKVFHGSESDIAWLQRDFDAFVVNMFDSYHAARILQFPRLSLAYLLERFLNVELDKKYQLADWRERPLTSEMIEYARKDTHYLIHLFFLLKKDLSIEKFEEVMSRSNKQCLVLYQPDEVTDKSWIAVLDRFNYRFTADQIALIKILFYWRQERAKILDVSPAAIMPNSWITKLVHAKAKNISEIRNCLRNMSDLLIAELPKLVEILNSKVEIPVVESAPFPEVTTMHTRFTDNETDANEPIADCELKKAKIEPEKPRRVISFASKPPSSSAASVFGAAKRDSKSTSSIMLSEVVKQNLPSISPELFISSDAKQETDQDISEVSEEECFQEEVKIHGANRTVDDLKLSYTTDSSTAILEQLRTNSVVKGFNPQPTKLVDFSSIKESILNENNAETVFDPYKTITPNDTKKQPFINSMPKANAPRLTSTPSSGNRIATFTKKSLKK